MTSLAQVGKGLSGPHYNLNIIGVPVDKTADMMDSNRHTIFVPLDTSGEIDKSVKIYFSRNVENPDKFQVIDGNATDDGRAEILVPYEFCQDLEAGCTDITSYDVYAVGLGKPNGMAIVSAECTIDGEVLDPNDQEATCTDLLHSGSFDIKRTKGKPKRENITDVFRISGCLDLATEGDFDLGPNGVCDEGDIAFNDLWVFNIEELMEYMWNYSNNDLKLMQLRFYPTSSGSIGSVK